MRTKFSGSVHTRLQKHLHASMPVGYPGTRSGVELRLLEDIFSQQEAQIALKMTHQLETAEQIHERLKDDGISLDELKAGLAEIANKGGLWTKEKDGAQHYALMSLVLGMWEYQVGRLSPDWFANFGKYMEQGYGVEFLGTAVPQMRVVPIDKSIPQKHKIATYDEIRDIVGKAEGRMGVANCVCRKAKDLIGEPCKKSDIRETCLVFRDWFDHYHKQGWARPIAKDECLDILKQAEENAFVLEPTNAQIPEFVCVCCGDCCGSLGALKQVPRPADYIASNYHARVDQDSCTGCGTCEDRCQMEAVKVLKAGVAAVDLARCIGCGLCVPTCDSEAIHMREKEKHIVPPIDKEEMFATILANKLDSWGRMKFIGRVIFKKARARKQISPPGPGG
jgi:electron transport complex protein RnfB